MKGLKRFQVVILLLLGMTLLPSSSAWSFRSDSGGFEQIVPDLDGYEYVGGGGASVSHGFDNETDWDNDSSRSRPLREERATLLVLLMSIWATVWATLR